ncbi:MAG: peptidylprolyl isomerase [Burkholderiaceae bacterium]|nr:peptidylprolyl isomerase [Burkholderiaceae bacterium]
MLDYIRTHQRIAQIILLIFIVPSFVFVGIEGYSRMGDSENTVAKVAGQKITQQEWDDALREQMNRMRQMLGPQFDAKMFESPEFKNDVLDGMIVQRALAAEVGRRNMTVTDQVLQQTILSIPGLTMADGKFDSERYKSILASQGLTPAAYEASLRHDLALQQIRSAVQASAFAPKAIASRISDIGSQEREVQPMLIKASDYVSKVTVTDQMLQDYYAQHGAEFEIPEQMRAEYVVLTAANVAAGITVSDADIKSYYEQNAKRYSTDEQRRASHILISVKKDASDADKAAAKNKAETLLAQVRKNPGDFAKLAKENSQDPGSAAKGGDLSFFGKGMMVKPFEETAFKLKQGEISDLVQSDFGYHIIMVTGIKAAAVKSLNDVKAEITQEIKKQLMAKKFAEVAEAFTNTVYEQADSLKPVADKLKLKVETVSGIKRELNPQVGKDVPYNNEKFLHALFADDAIKNKRNTEAVEIAPNVLIAGRVVEYKPAAKRPFDEVKAAIKQRVTLTEATALAKQEGEARIAKFKEGGNAAGFGEAKTVSRAKSQGLDPKLLATLMKADASKLPAYVGLEYPQQGYGIYRITKVSTPKPDEARRNAEAQQIGNMLSQQELLAYLNALKQKGKAKVLKPAAVGDAKK